jgi:hypothetical protein
VTRRRLAALVTLAALAIGGIGIVFAIGLPNLGRVPASGSVTAVGAPGARAGVDDFRFASFDAVYQLDRDAEARSTLHTTEHLVAVFPDIDQNRGIRRAIPAVYDGHSTQLHIVSVADADGTPRPYTSERDGDFLVLTIAVPEGQYVHGEQHYVIEYTERDVTRYFSDTGVDEFYRDVNGTGWAQPFGEVSARLELAPATAAAATGDASCYQGAEGSTARCSIDREDTGFVAHARDLGPQQNMTIAVAFREGTFVAPPFDLFALFPPFLIAGLGVILATIIAAVLYRIFGLRAAEGRGTIVAWYEPPENVTVPLAANLLGVPQRAFTASILDLAVRGKLRLLHDPAADAYGIRLLDRTGVSPDERHMVSRLFWSGSRVSPEVSDGLVKPDLDIRWFEPRERTLGLIAASVRKHADALALSAGLRRKPLSSPGGLVVLGLLVGFALLVVNAIVSGDEGVLAVTLALGINAIIWVAIGLASLVTSPRPLTRSGALIVEHLQGLREYIRLAEADRLRMLHSASGAERTPDESGVDVVRVYERLLPYAVLFGLEREWQAELSRYYGDVSPNWVESGPGPFTVVPFTAHLAAVPGIASSSSSWGTSSGSSSSGGSSGGGSSGGGGGGGGGGGV